MNGVNVTVVGYVAKDPTLMTAKSGITWTQFRVGSTRRWRDKEGNWVDGATMWFTVKCWEEKARNVSDSLRKGDPVIVSGQLSEEPYVLTKTVDDQPVTELRNGLVIDNATVGIDLARGTARYTRTERYSFEPQGVPNWLSDKVEENNLDNNLESAEFISGMPDDEPELVGVSGLNPAYALA